MFMIREGTDNLTMPCHLEKSPLDHFGCQYLFGELLGRMAAHRETILEQMKVTKNAVAAQVRQKGMFMERWMHRGAIRMKEIVVQSITRHLYIDVIATKLYNNTKYNELKDMEFERMAESMTDAELLERLMQLGIYQGNVPVSREVMIHVLSIVKDDEFWKYNYMVHPNAFRIRPWLRSHEYIRDQMGLIQGLVRTILQSSPMHRPSLVNRLYTTFQTFTENMKEHNDLEDMYIFRFFLQYMDDSCENVLNSIMHQRLDDFYAVNIKQALQDLMHVDVLVERMSVTISNKEVTQVQQYLDIYFDLLRKELDHEETVIIVRWLNLSAALHQTCVAQIPAKSPLVYNRPRIPWT